MKVIYLLAVSLVAVVIFGSSATAQNAVSSESSVTPQTAAEYYASVRQVFPVTLTEQQSQRLVERCEAAQDNLSKIYERVDRRYETYSSVYRLIGLQFTALSRRLAANSLDSKSFTELSKDYQEKSSSIETRMDAYRTALKYTRDVACKEEPDTFQSLLLNARQSRKEFTQALTDTDTILSYDMINAFTAVRAEIGRGEIE